MRVLCLHGRGASADVFQSQTAALRAKLDDSYTFEFIDGPHPASFAPGLDTMFGSNAFAWYPEESPACLRAAHAYLAAYLDTHGPYDVLMGFSQGCLLIASFLMTLQKQALDAGRPLALPVKGVVFVCGGLSLTSLEMLGATIPPAALDVERRSIAALHAKTALFKDYADNPEHIQKGVGLWDDVSGLVHDPNAPPPPPSDAFGLDFGDFPDDLVLRIPAVHVFGRRDPRYTSAIQLAYTCRDRRMYDHQGGHDIPRTTDVSVDIAQLIANLKRDIM